MGSTSMILPSTEAFLKETQIRYATSASSDYADLRQAFVHCSANPIAICRPQTAAEVQSLVKHCISDKVPFVVRGGGHDVFARSTLDNGLTIDLRDLKHVEVSDDKKTARIGGGINSEQLLEALREHGVHATTGTISTVGWVGWAAQGGYGTSSAWAGLGVDQIVAVRIVNADAELLDASEKALKGIRGGGAGNFGVIVEMTIKVYPVQEIQFGNLVYESTDIKATVTTFFHNYRDILEKEGPLPPNLTIQPSVLGLPDAGHMFFCIFNWYGTRNPDFHSWLSKIASCAAVAIKPDEAVQTRTAAQCLAEATAGLPAHAYSHMQNACVSEWSDEVIAIYAKHAALIPLTGGGLSMHELRECSPSCGPLSDYPGSVFAYRKPCIMFELIALGATVEDGEKANKWAADMRDEMVKVDAALEWSYPPLTAPEHFDLEKLFGENTEVLRQLKKELDPKGVFKNAVPRI